MKQTSLRIDDNTLLQIFKELPIGFSQLAMLARQVGFLPGILEPPRDEYPLFEHLMIWLYGRWINPSISKTTLFGSTLSTTQKTNLGEAMDYLIYGNFLPANAAIPHHVSLLSLCLHDKFGFRDDPVLLQRMWYIRAFLILQDNPDGAGPGERWKWYDHRMALVIYSWVRHNRKYHGCPKIHCPCRQIIDHYGLSIGMFKTLYMTLEKQCVRQLQFVRSNESVWKPAKGSKAVSRADEIKLYSLPTRNEWPYSLSSCVAEPDPVSSAPVSTPALVAPSSNTLAVPTNQSHHTSTAAKNSTLPPPHPSLPARPTVYTASTKAPSPSVPSEPIRPIDSFKWVTPLTESRPAAPLEASILQPPPPKDSPPPPPPPRESSRPTTFTHSWEAYKQNSTPSSAIGNSQPRQTDPGLTVIIHPTILSAPPQKSPSLPPTGPASILRQATGSREYSTMIPPGSTISSSATPTSPDKRIAPPSAPRSLSGTPGQQSVIPSAPRSMREVKAVSSGPIPTGPRSRTVVSKPPLPVGNTGRSSFYAGVPSAPRSMREPKSLVTGGGVIAGNQQEDTSNSTNLERSGSNGIYTGGMSPLIPSPTVDTIIPAGPKTSISVTGDREKSEVAGNALLMRFYSTLELGNTRSGPAIVPPATGKRSRAEAKADEIMAEAEMSAKPKVAQPSEGVGQSTPTMQRQSPTEMRGTPSSPPAKRLKSLPDSEGSSKATTKTPATKKSQAKDGAAILAAVSKQKGGPSAKVSAQGKDKVAGRSRKGANAKALVLEGSADMDKDVEMLDMNGPSHVPSSPQSTKTSSPPIPESSKTKAPSSVSPATATKRATSTTSTIKLDAAILTGSVGNSINVMASALKESISPNGSKNGPASTKESRPAGSTSSQSAQAILQAAANKKAAGGKISASARVYGTPRKAAAKTIFKPSPEMSTEDNSSEDGAVVDEYRVSSESDYISENRASPIISTQAIPRRQPSTRKSAAAATRSFASESHPEKLQNSEKEAAVPGRDSERTGAKQVSEPTEEMDPENVDSSKTLNRNTKAGRKLIRELSRGKGAKKPGTPATTVGNDESSSTVNEVMGHQPPQTPQSVSGDNQIPSSTIHGGSGNFASVESTASTKLTQGKSSSRTVAEARPKRKSTQKESSEVATSQGPGNAAATKESKQPSGSKLEVLDLSSDESAADNKKTKVTTVITMDLDGQGASFEAPVGKMNRITTIDVSKSKQASTSWLAMTTDITDIVAALQDGPPFPTVLVQADDPEKRMQTAPHEARRLMCALIAVGVPMEWWMVGVTANGFIVRDEAASLILPLLTGPTLKQLSAIGIAIEVIPAEPPSDSDEETQLAPLEFHSKVLPSPLQKVALSPLVIFDGQPERRLRSRAAEEKRLRNLVTGILGKSALDFGVEMNNLDNSVVDGVVCLVSPESTPSQLSNEQISRLGKAGLSIYQGESQLAGPLSTPEGAFIQSNDGTFDWRAMRTEVMKMKLPWEVSDSSTTPPPSSLYSPTAASHTSSFTELEDSPADVHFRQLLRPNLWSTSRTFSRMAASGMRWGEFNGVDPELSDDSDEDEPTEQRLGAAIHA